LDFGLTPEGDVRLLDVADGAVLVEYPEDSEQEANRRAVVAARELANRRPPGFLDAVPGARTLLVEFDPRHFSRDRLAEALRRRAHSGEGPDSSRRLLEVPVLYGLDREAGPDLEELARGAGLLPEEFARRHANADYRVAFLGFAPGFAYLAGLPEELRSPRLPTPRTRVPAGSIVIGGPYTGIYPGETPGGWKLIGRAPVRLFDPAKDPATLLLPGDRVSFREIGKEDFERRRALLEPAGVGPSPQGPDRALFRVAGPGVFTSVQGAPRHGRAIYGVPPGGAMDGEALRSGNALLGNSSFAPGLEMTLVGPELETLSEAIVALSGAGLEARLNEKPVESGTVCQLRAGDRLRLGPVRGTARAYLCVAGGLAQGTRLEPPRRLVSGDMVFSSVRPHARQDMPRQGSRASEAGAEIRIRVLPGPQQDRFEPGALETFLGGRYRVSAASDRRGIRLEGPLLASRGSADIPPEGTPLGAIQVPLDGRPIILGPDRPVTGGYAKIATVVSADFPLLGRALPGTALRFAQVTLAEALTARASSRE